MRVDWSEAFDFLNFVWYFGLSVGEGCAGVGSGFVDFVGGVCLTYSDQDHLDFFG